MYDGQKQRELREKSGLTHSDLARELYKQEDLQISRNTLINYEAGDTEPNITKAAAIAKFFGVAVDSLTK
jgi:DNA-binding XRE family transcriptional regulator